MPGGKSLFNWFIVPGAMIALTVWPFSSRTQAAAIAGGDIVVYEVSGTNAGTGTNAAPITIRDVNPNTDTVMQSFNVSQMASPLYSTTTNPVETMSLSANGTEVAFSGWTSPGQPGSGENGGLLGEIQGVPRGVGTLNLAGVYSQPATYNPATLVIGGDQPHAAYSASGSSWYMGDTGGVYTNNGTAALTGSDGTLAIKSFGGVTYALHTIPGNFQPDLGVNTSASELSVISPSSPSANTSSIKYTPVLTIPAAARDFSMISSGDNGIYDMLYVTSGQDIDKFGLINGVWTAEGSQDLGTNADGVAVVRQSVGGNDQYFGAQVYATRGSTVLGNGSVSGQIAHFTDFGGPSTFLNNGPIVDVYTAPQGSMLSGIVVVPEPSGVWMLAAAGVILLTRRHSRRAASIL